MAGEDDGKEIATAPHAKAAAQAKGKARAAKGRAVEAGEGHCTAANLTARESGEAAQTARSKSKPLESRSLTAAVKAALQRAADEAPPSNPSKLDLVADALVAKACAGDVTAIKAVFERVDGKPGSAPLAAGGPRRIVILHSFKSAI